MESAALVTAILPIGTIITVVAQEVLNTAIAAQDVLVDQESFKLLSKYLGDINGVLSDFQRQDLSDSPAIRSALDNMRARIIDAQGVIESAKGKSRFYLLMHCRSIRKNAESATRGIGSGLQLLLIAGSEMKLNVADKFHTLKDKMVTAEFEASTAETRVMDELQRGLQLNKTDQGFANDLLRDIAAAVGVPANETNMRTELASFRTEMEELVLQKQSQEAAFMEQVIAILDRSEIACPPVDSYGEYQRLARLADGADETYPPFPSFFCPFTKEVMEDPVILGTGPSFEIQEFTYEKEALLKWLRDTHNKDPRDGDAVLTKVELRPNNSLRESIREWANLNAIIRLRTTKEGISSGDETRHAEALAEIVVFCEKDPEHKFWVGADGLLQSILDSWRTTGSGEEVKNVRARILDAVAVIVADNQMNTDAFANAGGLVPLIRHLSTTRYPAKGVLLLRHLCASPTVRSKISATRGAILSLVTIFFHHSNDYSVSENMRSILEKLAESDENVTTMAKANWCYPLINRICKGSDASKVCMAKYLADTPVEHLSEDNKSAIAEGAVVPLVRMCEAGKLEAKMSALGALSNLSCCSRMRYFVASAGALPVVLQLQVSLMYPLDLRERAAAVFANLCSGDGIKIFLDAKKGFLPLYQSIEPFLHFDEEGSTVLKYHILRALLGMAQEREARLLILAGKGIPPLLSLMLSSENNTRDCVVKLLYLLSEEREGALEIGLILERRKEGNFLVKMLGDHVNPQARAAAAGIVENLPLEACPKLKSSLIAGGVVTALVHLARISGDENATGALRHFTDAGELEAQKAAAKHDILPLLVTQLHTGSIRARSRAAHILRDFSLNTSKLVSRPDSTAGWMCFMRPPTSGCCTVHQGECSIRGTFCLLEAEAVDPLVAMLEMADTEAAEAGVEALGTLVAGQNNGVNKSGAMALHEMRAIKPLLGLLTQGSSTCSQKALHVLECIFSIPKMAELYEKSARFPLLTLSSQPPGRATTLRAKKLLERLDSKGVSCS